MNLNNNLSNEEIRKQFFFFAIIAPIVLISLLVILSLTYQKFSPSFEHAFLTNIGFFVFGVITLFVGVYGIAHRTVSTLAVPEDSPIPWVVSFPVMLSNLFLGAIFGKESIKPLVWRGKTAVLISLGWIGLGIFLLGYGVWNTLIFQNVYRSNEIGQVLYNIGNTYNPVFVLILMSILLSVLPLVAIITFFMRFKVSTAPTKAVALVVTIIAIGLCFVVIFFHIRMASCYIQDIRNGTVSSYGTIVGYLTVARGQRSPDSRACSYASLFGNRFIKVSLDGNEAAPIYFSIDDNLYDQLTSKHVREGTFLYYPVTHLLQWIKPQN